MDANKTRTRALEKDLARERERVDAMKRKASNARKRIAESGASLESFLEELTQVRGELSSLTQNLGGSDRFREDLDMRITDLEVRLAQVYKALQDSDLIVDPAAVVPAGEETADEARSPESDAGQSEVEEPGQAAPDGDSGGEPQDSDIVIEPDGPPDDELMFQRCRHLVQESRWTEAGALLQQFLKQHPDSTYRTEARYLLGECLFAVDQFDSARKSYAEVIGADPGGTWGRRAMLKEALSVAKSGKQAIARSLLDDLIQQYPDSAEAAEARKRVEEFKQ